MQETRTTVNADYYQYYVWSERAEFDAAAVDMVGDGILAPARDGVRVSTGVHSGPVELTVRVIDEPILLPSHDDAVAAACNLELSTGVVLFADWSGGRTAFRHDFGRPVVCGVLVEVEGRDAARAHSYEPGAARPEHHRFTIAPVPFPHGRWRSGRMDRAGRELESFTDHVGVETATRPADLWYGIAGSASDVAGRQTELPRPHKVLAEEIAASAPEAQRRLAVWAAFEVSSRDGGTLPWDAALSAILERRPLPPPFDDPQRAREALPADRRGAGTAVAPAWATLAAVLAAAGDDPEVAALDALSHAASAEPAPVLFFQRARHYLEALQAGPVS